MGFETIPYETVGDLCSCNRGDWSKSPGGVVIEQAIAAYASAPAGYVAGFGVTSDGRTLLVEVNDGYSLGSYGLWPKLYAQPLSAH